MAELLMKQPIPYEPLRANRWIVRLEENLRKIPEWKISDFKLETVDIEETHRNKKHLKKSIKLTLHIFNSQHFLLLPDDVMTTERVKIEFSDAEKLI